MEYQSGFTTESYFSEADDHHITLTTDDPLSARRDRTIMSICTASSRCGCAVYYDSTISLVADRQDPGDPYKGLDIIIQRIEPDYIVISYAQKQLYSFIEKRFQFRIIDVSKGIRTSNDDVVEPAFTLAIVPNSWFKISHGEQKLVESEWIKSKGIIDLEERAIAVFSKINKSVDVCAIRAISAIDFYISNEPDSNITGDGQLVSAAFESSMDQSWNRMSQMSCTTRKTPSESKAPNDYMPIIDVRYIDPGPVLSIDSFTLKSLGILHDVKKKRGPPKDSPMPENVVPCLYDILDQCHSIQGKRTLRTMMMWPLQCMDEIQRRYEAVDFFVRSENRLLKDQLNTLLRNIMPLSGVLLYLSQTIGNFRTFSILHRSMASFLSIAELLRAQESEIEILQRIVKMDTPQLRHAVDHIVNTIDFEASKREPHIEVCRGVDEAVEKKREVISELTRICQEVEIEESAKYKDVLKKPCRVSFIPRIGFLESIQFSSTSEVESIRMNKEFGFVLGTEESVYFKTKRMEELDAQIGDVTCDLIDLQDEVVVKMQKVILEQSENILRLAEFCGELDCLIAFATVASQKGFVMPDLVASNHEIDIRDAFHPAQTACHNMVPNDIKFYKHDSRAARVMIITGPNACGKTTYMKTACLAIYMAHIGCFVPASSAKIPLVDAIFTRLYSADSISTGLSTFASDLHQVNYALSRATARSIIAVDEFGKGTQVSDGFHLLKGLLMYFVSRGHNSPYVMVATHFNRLVDYLQNLKDHLIYQTFKVKKDLLRESITYEFKVVDGISESSLADQVAINAGLPSNIIQRARQIRDYITSGREILQRPASGA